MAHGKSLILREICPHPRWRGYEPNPIRVEEKKVAKRLGITRRALQKMRKRARRG